MMMVGPCERCGGSGIDPDDHLDVCPDCEGTGQDGEDVELECVE
jgi:DnaJ-class molecular chaperone